MEFTKAVRSRRSTRRFRADLPVDPTVIRDLVDLAQRAPSAGFSQGWDVLALTDLTDRETFWSAASDPHRPADAWLRGVSTAPALLLMVADRAAYLDRYAEPDKGWADRSLDHWPIPYWDTDTAMAAMIILLGATDRGLDSLFFGIGAGFHESVQAALGIPADRRVIGVIALGHRAEDVRSPSLRRGRRPLDEVLHVGRFGTPGASE